MCVCVCARACMCAQLCPTLCNPMDCSLPGLYKYFLYTHLLVLVYVYIYIFLTKTILSTMPYNLKCY